MEMKLRYTGSVWWMIAFVASIQFTLHAEPLSPLRIEQNKAIADIRMGDLSVLVTDQDGSPVPGATVTMEQLQHDFHFGTALNIGSFGFQEYLDTAAAYFNHAVHEYEFEWVTVEPRRDNLSYNTADMVLNWCRYNNISMRAHALAWGNNLGDVPSWQNDLSSAELLEEMLERVQDVYDHYGDTSYTDYDVINEMTPTGSYTGYFYQNAVGWDGVAQMYAMTHNLLGQAYMNEFSVPGGLEDALHDVMDSIIAHGGIIDGVGMQAHTLSNVNSNTYKATLDGFWEKYQTRAKFTEVVIRGSESNQAAAYENLYRTAFAHTSCDGVLIWGFWENELWEPEGAWWTSDWTPKQVVSMYKGLVFDEWWSESESGTTGADGISTENVFYGTYKIRVDAYGGEHTKIVYGTMTREEGEKQVEVQLDGEYSIRDIAGLDQNYGLQVNPVLMSGTVEFNINSGNSFDTELSVYNVKGEKVWSRTVNKQYKVRWDYVGSQVSSGTYFVKADNGLKQVQKRFVIVN